MTVVVDTRRAFQQQLDGVRRDILRLAAHVGEAVPRATQAVLDADPSLAGAVLEHDAAIDDLVIVIEDRCYQQLALQQPMATDLRCLVSAMRLAGELGRCGDLAANVAKAVFRIVGAPGDARVRGLLQRMSDEAMSLVQLAVDAYDRQDVALARQLARMDDGLDALHRHYTSCVLDACRDGHLEIHLAVQLSLLGRFYERIGDHAVTIGDRVAFMVTGERPLDRVAVPAR